MSAIRQKFRPKHQVLILRCYPRFQRGSNVEVKPNSSELSYLLFYASSRRSKLPKVGAFLEKKTASDIYRNRQGNVQVTLQILKALIEKCAQDLPIFSSYVLQILHDVIHSHQAGLLESSTPTFEAFCKHYDAAQFAADKDHVQQFDDIINRYATFASRSNPSPSKVPIGANVRVRNRKAGITAIKSLVTAESFTADNGRQLRAILPVILENIHSDTPGLLSRLKLREQAQDDREKNQAARPRPSTTASYVEEPADADPANANGTTEDADERADEEVGVIAMQCLRQIFALDVPPQIRVATQGAVAFVSERCTNSTPRGQGQKASGQLEHWSVELFEDMSRWTSVQTRFVVLVTLTDALTRSPIAESDLGHQLALLKIISALLRSDITFIGLSVNDVLIGFVNHILLLLQLGGSGSGVRPHRQQKTSQGLLDVANETSRDQSPASAHVPETQTAQQASPLRVQLLEELSSAIGDLATHVYYADQISEMVGALLMRLKPPLNVVPSTAMAIENPATTAVAIADSGKLQESPHTDSYFSFDTARLLALNAIKNIIEIANSRPKAGQGSSNRNRVNTSTWEGTQWLLRDPCGKVRRAYVDALITWMLLELDKTHLRVPQDQPKRSRASKPDGPLSEGQAIAKRALSNASKRSIPNLRAHSNFLQLLHLAIYDNAIYFAESEPDMLLLHVLLVSMVQKLGVNSVRHGLPMIFRLQDDIPGLSSVSAKDAIGSLVHGYFWALSEFFDFDTTAVGRDIANEISRRSQLGLWLGPINVPALPIERIQNPTDEPPEPTPPTASQQTHALKPLSSRNDIIDSVNDAYSGSLLSPPSSPPVSPRRPMSSRSSSNKPPVFITPTDQQLPEDVRAQLMQPWTREQCVAEVERKIGRSSSLTGSKPGSGSGRGYLSVNGNGNGGLTPELSSSRNVSEVDLNRPNSRGNYTSRSTPDRPSLSAPASNSGRQSIRVGELQRIMETGQPSKFAYRFSQPVLDDDDDSDSMTSADVSSIA